jgi:hypothetical protein
MTSPTDNTNQEKIQENKPNDKELNFRALEAKLHQEKQARIEAEKRAEELARRQSNHSDDEEEDDDEPYVDNRKLNKKLAKFGQKAMQETQSEIQRAVHTALQEERRQNWIKSNGDFYDVLKHADKFAQENPELAETILEMPEGFERQKLVYQNIKKLGVDKPPQKQQTIQEKVDANRKGPYYQPSGVGTAPYASAGDFSEAGQKNAYDKMQALKRNLRI